MWGPGVVQLGGRTGRHVDLPFGHHGCTFAALHLRVHLRLLRSTPHRTNNTTSHLCNTTHVFVNNRSEQHPLDVEDHETGPGMFQRPPDSERAPPPNGASRAP
eukprot:1191957-Prorocentrum_minimum.AAC.1